MRKIFTNILLISSFLIGGNIANSCSKVEDLIDNISVPIPFSIPVNLDVTVPLIITNTTDYVRSPEVPVNLDLDAQIKEKYPSLSINNLKSVKLDLFTINYDSSEHNTKLNVIKNARILIKAPNMEAKVIAESLNNTSETTINFTPVANLQLLDYLKTNQNSIILEIQGQEIATDIMKLKIKAAFKLEVGL